MPETRATPSPSSRKRSDGRGLIVSALVSLAFAAAVLTMAATLALFQ